MQIYLPCLTQKLPALWQIWGLRQDDLKNVGSVLNFTSAQEVYEIQENHLNKNYQNFNALSKNKNTMSVLATAESIKK